MLLRQNFLLLSVCDCMRNNCMLTLGDVAAVYVKDYKPVLKRFSATTKFKQNKTWP